MMPKEIFLDEGVEEVRTSKAEPSMNSNSTQPKKKKRSQIWNHFIKVNQNKGARCHYCSHTLSFAAGSLSNLLRHLRKKHPTVIAGFRYINGRPLICDSRGILNVESANGESEMDNNNKSITNGGMQEIYGNPDDCDMKPVRVTVESDIDIESHFRQDHSYVEKPKVLHEELFGPFIQAELNKFRNDLLLRQCKREILRTLIKYQQTEDDLYNPAECPTID